MARREWTAIPGVLRGGNIRLMSTGEGPIAGFGAIPPGEAKSDWGAEWKKAALDWHDRAAAISSEAEHLAYRQNYVDLDPTYTDKYGDPLIRLTLDWTEHERAQGAMVTKVQARIAKAMDGRAAPPNSRLLERYTITQYQSTHVNGGAIMGTRAGYQRGESVAAALARAEPVGGGRIGLPAEWLGKPHAHHIWR